MAQTLVNFRMDEDKKAEMEKTCREMGFSMTTAFNMFATKVIKEKRIPFELTVDPFYSERNMKYLRQAMNEHKAGSSKLTAHELIEVDDE